MGDSRYSQKQPNDPIYRILIGATITSCVIMCVSLSKAIATEGVTSAQCFVAFILFLIGTVIGVVFTIAYLEDQK